MHGRVLIVGLLRRLAGPLAVFSLGILFIAFSGVTVEVRQPSVECLVIMSTQATSDSDFGLFRSLFPAGFVNRV